MYTPHQWGTGLAASVTLRRERFIPRVRWHPQELVEDSQCASRNGTDQCGTPPSARGAVDASAAEKQEREEDEEAEEESEEETKR
jgi:hypothetical protein